MVRDVCRRLVLYIYNMSLFRPDLVLLLNSLSDRLYLGFYIFLSCELIKIGCTVVYFSSYEHGLNWTYLTYLNYQTIGLASNNR